MQDYNWQETYPLFVFEGGHIETQGGFLPSKAQVKKIMEWCLRFDQVFPRQEDVDESNENDYEERLEQQRLDTLERQYQNRQNKGVKKDAECFIYVVKDIKRGLIKIGKANNVYNRFNQLKTANAEIELLTSYRGTIKDEKALHSYFDSDRVSGEWFCLTQDQIDFIETYFNQKRA